MDETRLDDARGRSGGPPPEQPRGRVTWLGWCLVASIPVLIVVMVIARRGTVADLAFAALALVILALGAAILRMPQRPPRRRPWRSPWQP